MELYTRLVKTLNSKGKIVPIESISTLLPTIKESDVDWYTSLFVYPKDMVTYFEKEQSVAAYSGPAYTDTLVWDFDNKDLNLVKEDVRELLRRLSKNLGGPEATLNHVSVWFSGGKGFHVYLKTNRKFSPKETKHICSTLAIGLRTFDPVVYNATRLFRFRNTKHNKTGLYKILIDPRMLKDSNAIEKITAMAQAPGSFEENTVPITDLSFIQDILDAEPLKKSVIVDTEEIDGIRGLDKVDFRKAKSIPKCLYALTHGIMKPGEGERNHIFLHLGNFYRNQGHSKEVVHNLLKAVARQNKQLYPEAEEFSKQEIWNTIIPRVFRDEHINPGGWGVEPDDPIFAKYCKSIPNECKCSIHNPKESSKVFKIEELTSDFDNFATNFHDNIVTTGIDFLDRNIKIARATTSLIVGASGCHRKGQGILMHDGSIKKVEDIVVGDKVMGPDSAARTVLNLVTGYDEMYKVTPVKGSPFYVNGEHVLSHKRYRSKKFVHATVKQIVDSDIGTRHRKLVRTGVEFAERSVNIDPYFLGVWLGDGHSHNASITTMDHEIKDYCEKYANSLGLNFTTGPVSGRSTTYYMTYLGKHGYGVKKGNILINALREYGLLNNKHIPKEYLLNSRSVRLAVLAGLLDTDGHMHLNCIDIIQKNKQLSDDIVFLSRSLGFAAYVTECRKGCQTGAVGTYYRVSISGDLSEIKPLLARKIATPRRQVKSVLHTGFSIEKVSDSEQYYGFTLDKDNLYLLDDFTITHNCGKTSAMINILQHTNKEGHLSYFASADMTKNLLYLKLAQRHCKLTQDEIFNAWKLQDRKVMKQVHDVVKEYYGNVYFDFAGNPTLEDLSQRIKEVEQREGDKVKLVIVDYASRLRGPYSDVNANEAYNALATKDVAADTDCAWIILNQISRASGDGSTPLRTKRAVKGSSAWEESASNVITMWRPFLDLHEVYDSDHDVTYYDKYVRIMSAKNRMGISKEEVLHWDGPTGRIWDMTPEERDRYDTEEKRKEKLVQIYRSPMKRQ